MFVLCKHPHHSARHILDDPVDVLRPLHPLHLNADIHHHDGVEGVRLGGVGHLGPLSHLVGGGLGAGPHLESGATPEHDEGCSGQGGQLAGHQGGEGEGLRPGLDGDLENIN